MSGSSIKVDARQHEWLLLNDLAHPKSLLTLTYKMVRSVRRGDVAQDGRDRADAVQIRSRRLGHLLVALHDYADGKLLPHGLLGGRN